MWRLALPAGATRDHPAANPFGPGSPALGPVDLRPLLVASGDRDMLIDRIKGYVARLKATGNKRVEFVEFSGRATGSPSPSRTARPRASWSKPHGVAPAPPS